MMARHDDFQTAIWQSHSADETRALGETVGAQLKKGDLVFLHGELGAGKTTFVSGVARALKLESEITSPTFVLIIEHASADKNAPSLLHLDAYRLENLDEHALSDAGIFDFLSRRDAVKIVEWPSCIADFLPTPRFEIWLRHAENTEHRVLEVRENAPFNNLSCK